MRQPRDAVGLAAARRMLDQVVAARPLVPRRGDQRAHRVELVVARKDQRLVRAPPHAAPRVLDLPLPRLDEQEVAQDVEKAVARQHVVPEVPGAVPGRMRRIARPALHRARPAAPVERQEAGLRAGEPRAHAHLVGVGREVDQRPRPEPEQRRARVAVLPVLPHRAPPRLAGGGVLQLAGRYRQPVHREQQVHRVAPAGMAGDLPRHRQVVLPVQRQRLVVPPVCGPEPRQPERPAVELEPVAQHVQRALHVELADQRVHQQLFESGAVQRPHRRPRLRLRRFDERADPRREQRPLDVPLGEAAAPPAPPQQRRLDVRFEGMLRGLGAHGMRLLQTAFINSDPERSRLGGKFE